MIFSKIEVVMMERVEGEEVSEGSWKGDVYYCTSGRGRGS